MARAAERTSQPCRRRALVHAQPDSLLRLKTLLAIQMSVISEAVVREGTYRLIFAPRTPGGR